MGRPRKEAVTVDRESYDFAKAIITRFSTNKAECEEYEQTHEDFLKQMGMTDAYNPEGCGVEEIFYRASIPDRAVQSAFEHYLEAKRCVFFVLHPILYLIDDEQTRTVAQRLFIEGEAIQYNSICVKGKIISERTIAREKKRAIAIIADYIDSYVQWETEQCFILRDGSYGCRRPEGWCVS